MVKKKRAAGSGGIPPSQKPDVQPPAKKIDVKSTLIPKRTKRRLK